MMTPGTQTDPGRRTPRWIVGLTGGIGAGKSTVAQRLCELGAQVVDADKTGHEVLREKEIVAQLTENFGKEILDPEGNIDRPKLAKVVFADPSKRGQLEAVVHPRMTVRMQEAVQRALDDPKTPMVVLDAAILLEKGWDGACDRILYVDAPFEVRRKRLHENRGWSEEELVSRERAQWPIEKKKARADFVIDNGQSLEQCRSQVDRIFSELVTET